jgi:hypothetical protein
LPTRRVRSAPITLTKIALALILAALALFLPHGSPPPPPTNQAAILAVSAPSDDVKPTIEVVKEQLACPPPMRLVPTAGEDGLECVSLPQASDHQSADLTIP